jgi:aminoglycoside phosphotransferase (APT) family kinase protein
MPGLTAGVIRRVVEMIEPGGRVLGIKTFEGSNATSLIEAGTSRGTPIRLVIRRYRPFAQYDLAQKARREFGAIELLTRHGVPVPSPLLLDDSGEVLGGPGIVTSWVEGRHLFEPTDSAHWSTELATTLVRIHGIPEARRDIPHLLDGDAEVSWFINGERPPQFLVSHPHGSIVWEQVKDHFPRRQMPPPGLTHVDYGTGNLLWKGNEVAAVLDWEEAAWGDPGYEVAYCRLDLIMLGLENEADRFLHSYAQQAGSLPANLGLWELAAAARPIFGWGAEAHEPPGRERLERFIAGAIRRLEV